MALPKFPPAIVDLNVKAVLDPSGAVADLRRMAAILTRAADALEALKHEPAADERVVATVDLADQLVHMWARDENDNPTGYALCDTGDGANTSVDGKIANSTWQVNCPKCEEIRDRDAETMPDA
jgi:hypothetical protein